MVKQDTARQAGEDRPAQAQAAAIEHAFGAIQVLAGPGSGKTYLTIRRIRHLICRHGISPEKILVITFTKAAASEMEERFYRLTEGQHRGVTFGTFHAVYFHMLKKSGYGGSRLAIATAQEKRDCLKHILHMHGMADADAEQLGSLLKEISRVKNSGGDTAAIDSEEEEIRHWFPAVFKEYCDMMQEMGKLDFDDMILLCDRMLSGQKEILAYWQRAFSHILVDEFQDISPLQYRVLKRLAAPEKNLFVVGDDDQSIYGFRGAGPNIMRQFMADYPEALQLTLDTNYRSAGHIVQASLQLISHNENRFVKRIRAQREESGHVGLHAFPGKEEEWQYLISSLKQMPPEKQEHTAVICRTNAQLAGLTPHLVQANIPFCCKDRMEHLFSHEIAKDFLAYLHFSREAYGFPAGQGKRKDFLRIMNRPCRYIRRQALDGGACPERTLREYYKQKPYMLECLEIFFTALKRIARLRPYLAIDYIRKTMGYDVYLCGNKGREEREKLLETADEIQRTAFGCRTAEEWDAYIAVYSECMERNVKDTETAKKGVWLVTMHGSKGLEYDNVFLPQVNAKLLPGSKAHTKEEVEEERRIFYVAMTRAKYRLEISYSQEPSPFLSQWADSPYVNKE